MMLSESRGEPLQTSSKKRGRREGERGEREGERGERGEGEAGRDEAGRGEGARDTDRTAEREREREGASCFIHSLLKQTHVSFIIVTLNKWRML